MKVMNTHAISHVDHHIDAEGARLGMWYFLFSEVLLFGGLFLLYSIYRSEFPAEFHDSSKQLSLAFGAVNTIILLTSSLTMALSIHFIKHGDKSKSALFLTLTIIAGFLFLINKYFEWGAKISHGIYPGSPQLLQNPHGVILFYGLYYAMTGLHGLHVLVGIIALCVMLVLLNKEIINPKRNVALENTGLYWHLVDMIWIFLFPLFYLIA